VVAASSATLARQIEHGAPADLFVSASTEWMDHLEAYALVTPSSRQVLVGNSLVLVAHARDAAPLDLAAEASLSERLGSGRLAVGDPAHVPAGRYAREALDALGLWAHVAARLAPAGDVRAALALVERGEAPLGVVYATDAEASDGVTVVASFPAESHSPVWYPMATVAGRSARPGVPQTVDCLLGPTSQQAFADRGFRLP
jgi:molybdate transport system substrate-binding protein